MELNDDQNNIPLFDENKPGEGIDVLKDVAKELKGIVDDKPTTPEDEAEAKKKANETLKQMYVEHFKIQGIDIEAEYELIKKKQSKLSRAKREAIMAYVLMFLKADEIKEVLKKAEDDYKAEHPGEQVPEDSLVPMAENAPLETPSEQESLQE